MLDRGAADGDRVEAAGDVLAGADGAAGGPPDAAGAGSQLATAVISASSTKPPVARPNARIMRRIVSPAPAASRGEPAACPVCCERVLL
jgi:hypothetical protein